MKDLTSQIRALIVEHSYKESSKIREELRVQKVFAESAQTHASELEVELAKSKEEVVRLNSLVWSMVEYVTLRDELRDYEEKLLNQIKGVV